MSLLELEELQKQIKLLLESGRIVPSSLPYGAPILFAEKKGGEGFACAPVESQTHSEHNHTVIRCFGIDQNVIHINQHTLVQ